MCVGRSDTTPYWKQTWLTPASQVTASPGDSLKLPSWGPIFWELLQIWSVMLYVLEAEAMKHTLRTRSPVFFLRCLSGNCTVVGSCAQTVTPVGALDRRGRNPPGTFWAAAFSAVSNSWPRLETAAQERIILWKPAAGRKAPEFGC